MGARYGNVMCLLIYWLLSANIEWLGAGVSGAPQAGGRGYRNMSLYGIWYKLDNQLSLSNHNMRISYVFHFPAQVQCHIISLPISYYIYVHIVNMLLTWAHKALQLTLKNKHTRTHTAIAFTWAVRMLSKANACSPLCVVYCCMFGIMCGMCRRL